jgi:plasmid stabilization system protein ParE
LAQIEFTPRALEDLERLFEFVAERDPDAWGAHLYAIRSAIDVLTDHPEIGRQMTGFVRELVISSGKTGYLAMYSYRAGRAQVRILAIRHQRELGYQ